jgi:hypothetical protein
MFVHSEGRLLADVLYQHYPNDNNRSGTHLPARWMGAVRAPAVPALWKNGVLTGVVATSCCTV